MNNQQRLCCVQWSVMLLGGWLYLVTPLLADTQRNNKVDNEENRENRENKENTMFSTLFQQGDAAFKQKNYQQSIDRYLAALAIGKQDKTRKKPSLALRYKGYHQLAIASMLLNQPVAAINYQQQAYQLDSQAPQAIKDYALLLKFAGGLYIKQKKYPQAVTHFKKSLTLNKTLYDNEQIVSVLGVLSLASLHTREIAQAEKTSLEKIRYQQRYFASDSTAIIESFLFLNTIYFDQANYLASQKLLTETLRYAKKHRLEDINIQIKIMRLLTLSEKNRAHYHAAKKYNQQVTTLLEQHHPEKHLAIANNKATLANILTNLYQLDEAEQLFNEVLQHYALEEKQTSHTQYEHFSLTTSTATALNNLATLYRQRGLYSLALETLQKSITLQQQEPEKTDSSYAALVKTQINKAVMQQDISDFKAAKQTLLNAEATLKQHYANDYFGFFPLYHSLTSLHITLGEYALATQYIEKNKALLVKNVAPNDLYYAWLYESLYALKKHQGDFAEAKKYVLKSLKLSENYLPKNHPDIANLYQMLAEINNDLGNYDQAEKNYLYNIKLHQTIHNKTHPSTLTALFKQAHFHIEQGRFKQAKQTLEANIIILKQQRYNTELLAKHLHTLGKLEQRMGAYTIAKKHLQHALSLYQQYLVDAGHHYLLEIKMNLAELEIEKGNYAQATRRYTAIINKQRERLPNSRVYLQQTLSKQARLYQKIGDYQHAKTALNESIQLAETLYAEGHIKRLKVRSQQVELAIQQGNYTQASEIIHKTRRIAQQKLHASHPIIASLYQQLASVQYHQAQYQRAQKSIQQAITYTQQNYGDNHPKIAIQKRALAKLYRQIGDFNRAEQTALQALAMTQHFHQNNHPDIAQSLATLASIYAQQGNAKKAKTFQQQALAINKALYHPFHPDIGVGYRQLAQLSITLKDYVSAEEEALKSINLLKKTLPISHPERLLARQTLVHSYLKQQHFDAARALIQQNIDSLSAHTDSPLFARTLHNQAELYSGLKQPKKALQAYQQALAIHQQLLPAAHPTLAIEQHALAKLQQQLSHPIQALKHATAASDILSKHQYLQHHFMQHNRHKNSYSKAIFMTQLRYTHAQTTPTYEQLNTAFKSLQQAQNPQRQQTLTHATLRFSTDKKPIQQQLRRLYRLKSNWRSLNEQRLFALSQPKTAVIHHYKQLNQQLATLDNHIKHLDQQLRKNLPHYAQFTNPRPVSLKKVQALLHPHEALISLITGESDSFLFIVKQGTATQLIRLNTHQKQLKKQLSRLRYALEATPQAVKQGRLPFFDLRLASTLYQQLLQPAEAALKNIKHLIIVTDDTLQNLPFATLITQAMPHAKTKSLTHNKRYTSAQWLIKRFSLSHLPAVHALPLLRDTATHPIATKNKTFIGFGDVTLNKTSPPIKLANLSRGLVANVDQLRQLPYLPDTKDELLTLAQLLKSNQDKNLYLNKRATETTIKQLSTEGKLADYRYIAFASHALLAKEAKTFNAPAEAGIVMTPPKIGNTADDGYLSSSEILNLTLNADMVILSACNTANLTEANESGLSSLSKAFFLAGTRSILASQWATHSLSSKALTTGLLQRSSQQSSAISHAEALRQSMLKHLYYQPACNLLCQTRDWLHIAKAPPTTPYAHPAYWAPFILIGDG